jgi:Domain of unknown function (DUF4158)
MPRYEKIPMYLNPEQRRVLTQIPSDLSDRGIARCYTFTQKERELINRRRRASNRLGFAVQLALLRCIVRLKSRDIPARPPTLAVSSLHGERAKAELAASNRWNPSKKR